MKQLFTLLALFWSIAADIPSMDERKKLVELHAQLRESVEPPASNMLMMAYSSELEALVNAWMANCSTDPPRPDAFSNEASLISKYTQGKRPTLFDEMALLSQQKELYNYADDKCSSFCYYYKQMVWATSGVFGCAQQHCGYMPDLSTPIYLTACLYVPPGNSLYERPYRSGQSCSECPGGSICYRKQCVSASTTLTVLGFLELLVVISHLAI
uniref:SCP domain-containing protein n=1 Tax=Mesocestoides corti TaxID=53468 RepID=A0A5K3FU07_MESCO